MEAFRKYQILDADVVNCVENHQNFAKIATLMVFRDMCLTW